jgi:chemosensory pili system protein ChpA (sensor histidine kinase/response regulator)
MGKNKQGTVLLNAYPQGNTIILEVEDDGKGLDLVKIKEAAISKGLLTDEAAETITQNQLIDYIFSPGFTTTESTTEISGRGVGLDVVRENILHLGGTISVQTEKNIGTRFIIKLPLTLAITQALLIESAGVSFALPLNSVEETVVLDTHKIGNIQDTEVIEIRNKSVPFLKLHEILHLPSQMNGRRFMPVVLLGSAGANAALLVDDLIGQEEIVVKQLGDFMEKVRYFSGATISGEGNVVLILDPTYIVGFDEFAISSTSTMESTLKERIEVEKEAIEQAEDKKHKLLLVDDSISIRKFVGKLLENAGYNVDVAIDGLEALSKVEGTYYNLIITDLEMPRMHGYEFISELKNNDRYKNIPVIVLTSRAGEKHKQKAMSKGADGYIVKPFNEEILLENIGRFL